MTVLTSNDPSVARLPKTPAPVTCAFCGAERHTRGMNICGTIVWYPGGPNPCTCAEGAAQFEREQAEREAKIAAAKQAAEDKQRRGQILRLAQKSGIGTRFKQRTFQTFVADTPERKNVLKAAQAYARTFGQGQTKQGALLPGRNGLLITGSVGVGKTHVAAAIANHLLSRGTPVICMTERSLLGEIKSTYTAGIDEKKVRELYESVPLLIIDDLGKERPTEWTLSAIYAIVDGRYERALPLIITTNYDRKKLIARLTPASPDSTKDLTTASAIVDRFTEMCESLHMTGESWRSK